MSIRRVVALGFFDGVHLGHAALLQKTVQRAAELNAVSSAMSFDVHPDTLVRGCAVPLISTADERAQLMRALCGVQDVIFAHFDAQMMHMPWRDFVDTYLIGQLHACHVVCGHDYRFGARGEGTPEKLNAYCAARGVGCDIIGKVTLDGETVSSTRIRAFLQNGQMDKATAFLGHPHLVTGAVSHGAHRGTGIGFPTANLVFQPNVLVPKRGVYLAEASFDGTRFPALVNIGVHPTAGALEAPVLEAWLDGFSGDLYGKELSVWLSRFIRDERPFSSMEALRAQLARDQITLQEYRSNAAHPNHGSIAPAL